MVDDRIDPVYQRHLDPILLLQLQSCGDGIDSFHHHTDLFDSFFRLHTLSDQMAAAVISGMLGGGSNDQVANPGKTVERPGITAHCHSQKRNLMHASRDQRGLRIISISQSKGSTACKRDDILHCAAQFDPQNVFIRIDPHDIIHEDLLYDPGCLLILARCNDRSRQILGNLLCMGRS